MAVQESLIDGYQIEKIDQEILQTTTIYDKIIEKLLQMKKI